MFITLLTPYSIIKINGFRVHITGIAYFIAGAGIET
jgi:hypothetical protein